MKIKYLLCFGLFFSAELFSKYGDKINAQTQTIDSLLALLKTDKPDTNKVNHLNKLSWAYIHIIQYNSALKYGNKALALASSLPLTYGEGNRVGYGYGIGKAYESLGNINYFLCNYPASLKYHFAALKIWKDIGNKHGIAYSYEYIGFVFGKQSHFSEALKNYFFALKTYEEIGNKQAVASCYNYIGIIYWNKTEYPEALENYHAALKIFENIGDKNRISGTLGNIGIIHWNQKNYDEALKDFMTALKIKKEIGDKPGIANTYNNIGNIYISKGNYPEALKNYQEALIIDEAINNRQGVSSTNNNIGIIYYTLGNYTKALKKYLASLKINEDIGDKEGIAESFINLGEVHIKLNKLKEAKRFLDDALQKACEISSKEMIKESYHSLDILDSMQGNWKSAYHHHKLFIIYRDSIDNEETKKKIIESSMTYEFEKKETATKAEQDKKDSITEANKKRQQVVLLLVSCVLLLVFIFAGFVVRSLRITRKQKNIIELQKSEVFRQKEMVSEKNKEITDSINYAQRIQRALLASDKMLNENLTSPLLWRGAGGEASFFIFFQPKDIVSGDFYWASPLENGNFALVTADSTGHGVPGAIMSMLNISCLNEAVKGQQLTAPNEILNYTRGKIIEHLSNDGSAEGGKDGMDCSLISFEQLSPSGEGLGLRLTYSAANNPIWIVRNKQITELEPDKMPVGKHERDKISFTQHTIELQKNDIVYTITDGYSDQFGGAKGKKYMAKQLKELLISISHLSMNEQKEALYSELISWKGNLEQIDDITIIGIRV